jgi:hypothetical protein
LLAWGGSIAPFAFYGIHTTTIQNKLDTCQEVVLKEVKESGCEGLLYRDT